AWSSCCTPSPISSSDFTCSCTSAAPPIVSAVTETEERAAAKADPLSLLLFEPEVEQDVRAILQRNVVVVRRARFQGLGAHVEDPLLVSRTPAKIGVWSRGHHVLVNRPYRSGAFHELEARHHARRADRVPVCVAHAELRGDGAALLEDAGSVGVHRLQDLVPGRC